MAAKKKPIKCQQYSKNELEQVIEKVSEGEMSLRQAEGAFGVPKSTLSGYVSGKVKIGQTQGPPTVLTNEEEARLAKWAMEMARIGYGRSKEQILLTVQKIVEMEKRPNTFKNGKPGKKWWQGFLRRHPELSLRKPEQLESIRAATCTEQRLTQWFADFEKFLEMNEINDDPRYFWNANESGFALCPKSGKVLCQTNTKDLYTISGNCKDQITVLCSGSAAGEVIPRCISIQVFVLGITLSKVGWQERISGNLRMDGLTQSFSTAGLPITLLVKSKCAQLCYLWTATDLMLTCKFQHFARRMASISIVYSHTRHI